MKYTLEVSVTSIKVSENMNFLEEVLASVSLTLTSRVEVSICGLSKMYLTGGAGFSEVTVKFEVKNTGDYDAKYTVELYSRDHYASVTPSIRRLREFEKKDIVKGGSVIYELAIPVSRLSFIGQDMVTTLEEGAFDLIIEGKRKEIFIKAN